MKTIQIKYVIETDTHGILYPPPLQLFKVINEVSETFILPLKEEKKEVLGIEFGVEKVTSDDAQMDYIIVLHPFVEYDRIKKEIINKRWKCTWRSLKGRIDSSISLLKEYKQKFLDDGWQVAT